MISLGVDYEKANDYIAELKQKSAVVDSLQAEFLSNNDLSLFSGSPSKLRSKSNNFTELPLVIHQTKEERNSLLEALNTNFKEGQEMIPKLQFTIAKRNNSLFRFIN